MSVAKENKVVHGNDLIVIGQEIKEALSDMVISESIGDTDPLEAPIALPKMNAELYVMGRGYVAKLYIRAPKGNINPETDTLVFARHVHTAISSYRKRSKSDYQKGWIRPSAYNNIPIVYSKDTSLSDNVTEYFEIKPGVLPYSRFTDDYSDTYNNFQYLQQDIDYFRSDYANVQGSPAGNCPASLNKKCGICIERNGVRITPYLRFSIKSDSNGKYGIQVI